MASAIEVTPESFYADFFDKNLYDRVTQYLLLSRSLPRLAGRRPQARNVNNFDEVPDDRAWFMNRNGRALLSAAAVEAGPMETGGPSADGAWVITRGKSTGITTGFFITDARGDGYLLKFDHAEYPELASAAEVITSRLFHAIGYHVPQYTVAWLDPGRVTVAPGATFYDTDGFKKPLTRARALDLLARRAARGPDGRYRASASLLLRGSPRGPFSLTSRRREDPADLVPHKDRREVRALMVFGAWANHHDLRKGNTLDVVVEEGGRQFVKHYLIDFGSSLGVSALVPKPPEAGREHVLDFREITASLVTLGVHRRPWMDPPPVAGPTIGRIGAEGFAADRWKPELPHFAFDDLTPRDAFWAAKIVASFTDDQIAAAVRAGELSDPSAADHLARVLAQRRDALVAHWVARVGALDRFSAVVDPATGPVLHFEDLAARAGLAPDGRRYGFRWFRQARPASRWVSFHEPGVADGPAIDLRPFLLERMVADARPGAVYRLELEPQRTDGTVAGRRVWVLFRPAPDGVGLRVAGLVREE